MGALGRLFVPILLQSEFKIQAVEQEVLQKMEFIIPSIGLWLVIS